MNNSDSESIRQSPLQFLATETASSRSVAEFTDLSLLEKWGVKGPGAASWLEEKGLDVPPTIYASRPLPQGGLIVRVGTEEFFIEAAQSDVSLAWLRDSMPDDATFTPVIREDAAMLITGSGSRDLFAQTCSHRIEQSPCDQMIFTRVAGVSCGILPQSAGDSMQYRLWFDPSYATYLGETLLQIVSELSGDAADSSV